MVDTSTVVNVESLEVSPTPPPPTVETSGTPSPTTSNISPSSSRPSLTQVMKFQMGSLAHSVDVRACRVEATISIMIEFAIEATLAPIQEEMMGQRQLLTDYGLRLDTLTARVEGCQKKEAGFIDLTALKGDIAVLRKDVDELKSTNISML